MPHSDIWDVNTPVESDYIGQGDDEIRTLKRALDERLRDLLNWDADPVTLLDGIVAQNHLDPAFTAKLGQILMFQVGLTGGAIAAGATETSSFPAPGVVPGDVVVCTISPWDNTWILMRIFAYVSAADEITTVVHSLNAGTVTTPSTGLYIAVIRALS